MKSSAETANDTVQIQDQDTVLDQNAVYVFSDDVSHQSVAAAIRFILFKNFLPAAQRPKHITMLIMSGGGDLQAAFALIDVMQGSQIPVHTLGLGLIASAALLIFMSGHAGHRTITPNTSILSHQFSWGSEGKFHELVATGREFQLTQARLLQHIRNCTGITDTEKIREHLLPPSDVWLSAREAVRLGIADRVHRWPNRTGKSDKKHTDDLDQCTKATAEFS